MAFYSHWQAAWRARRLIHRVNRRLFDALLARASKTILDHGRMGYSGLWHTMRQPDVQLDDG